MFENSPSSSPINSRECDGPSELWLIQHLPSARQWRQSLNRASRSRASSDEARLLRSMCSGRLGDEAVSDRFDAKDDNGEPKGRGVFPVAESF